MVSTPCLRLHSQISPVAFMFVSTVAIALVCARVTAGMPRTNATATSQHHRCVAGFISDLLSEPRYRHCRAASIRQVESGTAMDTRRPASFVDERSGGRAKRDR